MKPKQNERPTILVFETNIKFKKDITKIGRLINTETRIKKWNVDLHDCAKVLRIESFGLHPTEIVRLVTNAGFHCNELQD
jgi:tRNA G26 N,N-dimethylase Trm1